MNPERNFVANTMFLIISWP